MASSRPSQTCRFFRFGQFELSEGDGELRKNGIPIRLQDQPMRVLVELLANSGRVVTREELHRGYGSRTLSLKQEAMDRYKGTKEHESDHE